MGIDINVNTLHYLGTVVNLKHKYT